MRLIVSFVWIPTNTFSKLSYQLVCVTHNRGLNYVGKWRTLRIQIGLEFAWHERAPHIPPPGTQNKCTRGTYYFMALRSVVWYSRG